MNYSHDNSMTTGIAEYLGSAQSSAMERGRLVLAIDPRHPNEPVTIPQLQPVFGVFGHLLQVHNADIDVTSQL